MPGPHRRFLEYLTEITNVRDFAFSHHPDSAVRNAYNSAVASLVGLRDKHMQLVARYILLAAKTHPVKNSSDQVNLATATAKIKDTDQDSEFHGTGGTSLMPFLKQTRDATRAAARYEG